MTITWYDATDTQITAAFALTADRGTIGAAVRLDVYNKRNGTGAATLQDIFLEVLQLVSDEPVAYGTEILDDHHVEARLVAGLGFAVTATPWTPIGHGRWLALPALGNDLGLHLEVRLNSPQTAQITSARVLFQLVSRTTRPLPIGLTESSLDGVLSGAGDGTLSAISSFGGLAENPGGADDQVEVGDAIWLAQGTPRVRLTELVTLDGNDGSSVALAAGERYVATFSLAVDGGLTVTKSDKSSGTPPTPAVPTDEEGLGSVVREFDGIINNADITETFVLGFFAYQASGLNVTLGHGEARLDNRLIHSDATAQLTLASSSTTDVWLLSDGSKALTTDGSRPELRALRLWTFTTNGSVTAAVDRRVFIGGRALPLSLAIVNSAGLAVNDEAQSANPYGRPVQIALHRPVQIWLHDLGVTPTAGSTQVDVEYSVDGAAWVSFFTSSGTDDRRPAVLFSATDPRAQGVPEVTVIPAFARLRARISGVVTATTPPLGVTVGLELEVP